jgi:hypothetical protein
MAPASGRGEVIIGGMTGNQASPALWAALTALGTYYDAKPNVLGAFVTSGDDEIQALFEANRGGQAVRGIAYVQATGSQCIAAFVDDRADQFSSSSAELVQLAQQSFPATASGTPVPLHRTTLSDGSTLDLPDGWTASANNGMVSAHGPEGGVDFGLSTEVHTPAEAAQYPVRPPLVSEYGDPGRAYQELSAQLGIVQSTDSLQIVERAPVPWWTSGVGEMLHVTQSGGQQREGVVEVLTSQSGFGRWMFYYSGVSTEQQNFSKNLPVLMRIWQSWKTDDHIFQERLMRAAESMQACSRIIQAANAFRQDAMERSSLAWDHIVRGTWPIEDQQTHSRLIPQQDVSVVVRSLNESEGYERWRVVPYEELNR